MGDTVEAADEALKAVQLEIAKADLRLKELDIRHRPGPWRALFTNPILIGAFITGYVAIISSYFAAENARHQIEVDAASRNGLLQLERLKFESSLVLEAIKTGDADKAVINLDFLIKSGLLPDPDGLLKSYMAARLPGKRVDLPGKS